MKKNGESRIMVGALVALALFCSLWTTQANAYPTFQFSGTAAVAGFFADPASGTDFDVYDINYFISLSPTTATMYTEGFASTPPGVVPAVIGSPHLLTQMAGSIILTGGFDQTTDAPAGINLTANFNDLLFVSYDPDFLALSFGIDDGTGLTSEMFGVYDFGLDANYNLLSVFGPFIVPPTFFYTDGFGPLSDDGVSGFTDLAGNLLDLEVLTNDATVSAVPEPSTLLLLGAGLAGLGFWRRRKP